MLLKARSKSGVHHFQSQPVGGDLVTGFTYLQERIGNEVVIQTTKCSAETGRIEVRTQSAVCPSLQIRYWNPEGEQSSRAWCNCSLVL